MTLLCFDPQCMYQSVFFYSDIFFLVFNSLKLLAEVRGLKLLHDKQVQKINLLQQELVGLISHDDASMLFTSVIVYSL